MRWEWTPRRKDQAVGKWQGWRGGGSGPAGPREIGFSAFKRETEAWAGRLS